MRKVTLALILLSTTPVLAQIDNESSANEAFEAILAQERKALDRWSSGDPLGYLEVDADDVTYFDDIGASSRIDGKGEMQAYLEMLVGKVPPHSYEIIDPKVQVYGDVGILTLHYQGMLEDGTPAPVWKATSVYRLADEEWRIVHAHWSLVKEPAKDQ
jgi:ketosteroid isomerase-like protein